MLFSCSSKEELLIKSIENRDIGKVKSLLDGGVSPNNDTYETNPLEVAFSIKEYEIALLLIENGFRTILDNLDLLDRAVSIRSIEEIKILTQSSYIDASSVIHSTGQTLLYWACSYSDIDLLKSLANDEWILDEVHNSQPLLISLYENFGQEGLAMVDEISKKAMVLSNSNGATVLSLAYINADFDSFEYLIEKGADISEMSNRDGWFVIGRYWTESSDAFFRNEYWRKILSQDANSEIITGMIFNTNFSETIRLERIQRFIDLGVDPWDKDSFGMTPMDYALEIGYGTSISIPTEEEKEEIRNQKRYGEKVIELLLASSE